MHTSISNTDFLFEHVTSRNSFSIRWPSSKLQKLLLVAVDRYATLNTSSDHDCDRQTYCRCFRCQYSNHLHWISTVRFIFDDFVKCEYWMTAYPIPQSQLRVEPAILISVKYTLSACNGRWAVFGFGKTASAKLLPLMSIEMFWTRLKL